MVPPWVGSDPMTFLWSGLSCGGILGCRSVARLPTSPEHVGFPVGEKHGGDARLLVSVLCGSVSLPRASKSLVYPASAPLQLSQRSLTGM